MSYRDLIVRLGDATEQKVLGIYRQFVAGQLSRDKTVALMARIIAVANSRRGPGGYVSGVHAHARTRYPRGDRGSCSPRGGSGPVAQGVYDGPAGCGGIRGTGGDRRASGAL
ncbi:hypothetical protein BTZ20_4468 [Rhodococcus sp. MTM3W5.2]|nr:hypothetical protein BTZ20_4468 [Rhodococcus sp. MTM3W5.2]